MLWQPDPGARDRTCLGRFWDLAEQHVDRTFPDYPAFHRWSVQDPEAFWGLYAEFADIKFLTDPDHVKGPDRMPGTSWFPGARLNYAQNLLYRRDDHPAIIALTESGAARSLTFSDLYHDVAACAAALRGIGVVPGDRVAAFMANVPETVIAFLACASIGATLEMLNSVKTSKWSESASGPVRSRCPLPTSSSKPGGRRTMT